MGVYIVHSLYVIQFNIYIVNIVNIVKDKNKLINY